MATEVGNAAAEAAIQADGGYGYTSEWLFEKIEATYGSPRSKGTSRSWT
jgi:alkylation response protein AidB-like acyl-CoA dehydrogenase